VNRIVAASVITLDVFKHYKRTGWPTDLHKLQLLVTNSHYAGKDLFAYFALEFFPSVLYSIVRMLLGDLVIDPLLEARVMNILLEAFAIAG